MSTFARFVLHVPVLDWHFSGEQNPGAMWRHHEGGQRRNGMTVRGTLLARRGQREALWSLTGM
ncbi:MAG: hypothetical protein HN899_10715 [Gemmatimonadales bacterium]|nr:hypothetical protein [Gemmatimonadales bacterium]MBT7125628.1 hypothetical protein [Gemmatimonadales bacterium]